MTLDHNLEYKAIAASLFLAKNYSYRHFYRFLSWSFFGINSYEISVRGGTVKTPCM